MAIYKPSNCMPFLDSLDLSEDHDVQCELNTSNNQVVGYKMKITDGQNNEIFTGPEFTPLNDSSLDKYQNDGLNGSLLTLPLVVSAPEYSNKNNIFFDEYKWDYWKPDFKIIPNDGSYYFKGYQYVRISSQTIVETTYSSFTTNTIYMSVNGYYRTLSEEGLSDKPSWSDIDNYEYYYKTDSLSFTPIFKDSPANNRVVLAEKDYLNISNGIYDGQSDSNLLKPSKKQAVDDHVYYKGYKIINSNTITQDQYSLLDAVYSRSYSYETYSGAKPDTIQEAVEHELYYNDYYSPWDVKPTYRFAYLRCYYKDDSNDMQIVSTQEQYSTASVLYDKIIDYKSIDMLNRPAWENAWETEPLYYNKTFYELLMYTPTSTEAVGNYYYLTNENTFAVITSSVYSSVVSFYKKDASYNPLTPNDDNSTIGIFYYEPLDNETSYNDCPLLFEKAYVSVAGLDINFYKNNIIHLYEQDNTYTEHNESTQPPKPENMLQAAYNKYYFLDDYKPATYEYEQFYNDDIQSSLRVHDNGSFYVVDSEKGVKTQNDAHQESLCYINFVAVTKPASKTEAILKHLYYYDASNTGGISDGYFLITEDMSNNFYASSSVSVFKFDHFVETSQGPGNTTRTQYRKLSNFYNGYLYQPYKWQVDLMQGDMGDKDVTDVRSKWFDMQITNGTVLGSCTERVQGLFSEEIYKDYYLQLCRGNGYTPRSDYKSFNSIENYVGSYIFLSDNYTLVTWDNYNTLPITPGTTVAFYGPFSPIGDRVLIDSYDGSFGYIYPQKGVIKQDQISEASYFAVYKYTNDKEYVSANRKVGYVVTQDINLALEIDGVEYSVTNTGGSSFKKADNFAYYTQVFTSQDGADTFSSGQLTINMYDQDSGVTAPVVVGIGGTSFLIKNQGGAPDYSSAINGVYYLVSVDADTTNTPHTTTLRWQRTADADSYADYINGVFYIMNGSSAGKNFTSDAQSGGVIDTTPMTFFEERPVTLYPTNSDDQKAKAKHESYYQQVDIDAVDNNGNKIIECYSPLFKNGIQNGIAWTYIRPFVGIQKDMRFQYGETVVDSVLINDVDTDVWKITHNALQFNRILKANTDKYIISSYYKTSDENPFYAYKRPYIDIKINNVTGSIDHSANPIIINRYVISDATYSQEQNKSWKNYQWTLYDVTNDLEVAKSDVTYSGSFQNKFIGLENNNIYRLILTVENEMGYSQETYQDLILYANLEYGALPISANAQCMSQSIDMSIVQIGLVSPNPPYASSDIIKYNYNVDKKDGSMTIGDGEANRDYAIRYSEAVSERGSEPISAPKDNSFRVVSSHKLGSYYQGSVVQYLFNKYETSPVQDDERFLLDIICEPDTKKNSSGEIILNPKRNQFTIKFTKQKYIGGTWEDESDTNNFELSYEWRRTVLPYKFALVDESSSSGQISYDYIYTTQAYESDGTTAISGQYNLASVNYNPMISSEENTEQEFLYPLNSTNPYYTCDNGVNMSPLASAAVSSDETLGGWYDQQVAANDLTGTLLLQNRALAQWSDTGKIWSDNSPGFYRQINQNASNNFSGKQLLSGNTFVFDISISNYDEEEKTGDFSYDVHVWMISENGSPTLIEENQD